MSKNSVEVKANLDIVKDGDPVQLFAVGGSISHAEKRFVEQYNSNDYFTSYQMQFSRPVSLADSKGMSSVNRQLALAMSLATQVNRKCQARDGIKPRIGPEVQVELALTPDGKIAEGAVLPGKEIDSIRAQLGSLRASTDAAVNMAANESPAPAAEKKTTRKRKSETPATETPAETNDMGEATAPVEEVL